jgi:hypothetical protein
VESERLTRKKAGWKIAKSNTCPFCKDPEAGLGFGGLKMHVALKHRGNHPSVTELGAFT